ncbi:MAG TPA: peptide deformylase [bacterium]|nr:peptide deformylase [bacterium]
MQLGNPRLAQPSAPLNLTVLASPGVQARLGVLRQALDVYEGVGIAAPQIGWYERVFLMVLRHDLGYGKPSEEHLAWINPEVIHVYSRQAWAWEGCLSVPGLRGWIRRPDIIVVRGFDAQGKRQEREFSGWASRVFQHEYDHLEGVLYPYRAQDPRHLVTLEELARRAEWPPDWPAPGAARTAPGQVLLEE